MALLYSAIVAMAFSEHLIHGSIQEQSDGFNYPYGHWVSDFDNDGDIDITVCDVFSDDRFRAPGGTQITACYWIENTAGQFDRHFIPHIESGFLERHSAGDVDNDTRPDLVVGNNRDGGILWYGRHGDHWRRHRIAWPEPFMARTYDLRIADFDNDGCSDIVVGAYQGATVVLYKNPCADKLWEPYIIGEKMPHVRTVQTADIDGDGDLDVLAASTGVPGVPVGEANPENHGSYIRWFENPGHFPTTLWSAITAGEWPVHTIDASTRGPAHGRALDMDGDGDIDILMSFGMRDDMAPAEHHHVAWYEQTQSGWVKHHVIDIPYVIDVDAADIDGDGVMEIAYAAHDSGSGTDNLGDQVGLIVHGERIVLRSEWTAANQVSFADMNGDGHPDIVATADDGNGGPRRPGGREVRWWEYRPEWR